MIAPRAAGAFPSTRWSLVLAAQREEGARSAALGELLALYWPPLYCLARKRGLAPAAAEDAVQGFCARLLEREVVQRLDPAKGRLRGYLRTSFDHFLANEAAREGAQRRGAGAVVFDAQAAERAAASEESSPEKAYERAWAQQLMQRAQQRLMAELAQGRRPESAALVRRFFGSEPAPPYAEAAREHRLSIPALKTLLHRARARFRELVREEIADTVADPSEVDAELAHLQELLAP